MAFKTVVKDQFVRQLIECVKDLETTQGPFTLAMLVPSESGLTDRWNMVVSAKWSDDKGLKQAIPIVTSSLVDHLSRANVGKIDRVSPLSTGEAIVRELTSEAEVTPGTAVRGESFTLTKRGIPEAIILAAKNPAFSPNRQPQVAHARG